MAHKFFNNTVKDIASEAWKIAKGETLHSNAPIIPKQFDNFVGASQLVNKGIKSGNWKQSAEEVFKNQDGSFNAGKIAGSFVGASAAARIATGGGLTRDRHGNTNIIGVPFI